MGINEVRLLHLHNCCTTVAKNIMRGKMFTTTFIMREQREEGSVIAKKMGSQGYHARPYSGHSVIAQLLKKTMQSSTVGSPLAQLKLTNIVVFAMVFARLGGGPGS